MSVPSLEIKKPQLPNLALGSFIQGPSEEVAAVDVYDLGKELTKDSKKLFTSVKEINEKADKTLYSFVNNPTQLADFIKVSSKTPDGVEVDEGTFMYRITQTSSDLRHALSELGADVKNATMFKMSKDTKAKIECTIGDVKTLVSASKVRDINSLGNFVNKYTNSNTFNKKDTGAISALLASVVAKTQELGITDVYNKFTGVIQDNAILRNMTKILVPIAIVKNYPKLLSQMASGPYSKIMNMIAPGITRDFVRGYSMKGGGGFGRPISTFDDFIGTVDRMTVGWGKTKREGAGDEEVFDLSDLVGGSRDFQRLLSTGVSYFYAGATKQNGQTGSVGFGSIASRMPGAFDGITTTQGHKIYAAYGLAGFYQQVSAAASVKKYFPKVALTGTYDESIPVAKTNTSRTMRVSTRNSVSDTSLINHVIASLF